MKFAVKRAAPVLFAVVLVFGIWLLWRSQQPAGIGTVETVPLDSTPTNVIVTSVSTPAVVPSGPVAPLLGETILRDYANPNLPPQNDLTLMSRLMGNSLLLLKAAGNRPLSANEDWADFLRGRNAARERFLSDPHVALNANGQLIDRWGTPLFFHALGGGRFELRSGGPDKKLWTADDLHRNADGSFRRGTNLNPESLLPRTY